MMRVKHGRKMNHISQVEGAGRTGGEGQVLWRAGTVTVTVGSDGAISSGPVTSFPVQVINYCWA